MAKEGNAAFKLALQLSETREKLNALSLKEELSQEEEQEMRSLTDSYPQLEARWRAAATAEEGRPVETDSEDRERKQLLEKSGLAPYVAAALTGTEVRGAEHELSDAFGCPGQVPLELFCQRREERAAQPVTEERAITAAPADVGVTQAPIGRGVFLGNVAPFLMVDTPMVATGERAYPVITQNLTSAARDKDKQAPGTAGTITTTTAEPKRISGFLEFRVEDAALLSGMEEALRENLNSALGNAFDDLICNGQVAVADTVSAIPGFFSAANPVIPAATDESNADGFGSYVKKMASGLDGLYATVPGAIRLLSSPEVVGDMLSEIHTGSGVSAYEHCGRVFGGVQSSDRIGHPSNVGPGMLRLTSVMEQAAVAPIWQGVRLIRDEITNADKGQVKVTALMLASGVKVLRASAYKALSFKTA